MNELVSINDARKPKDGEECLVFTKSAYGKWYKIASFSENLSLVDGIYLCSKKYPGFYDYDSEFGFYEVTGVTHWMSLPDEPEEE